MFAPAPHSNLEMNHAAHLQLCDEEKGPRWFAVYTMPKSEKAVCRMLDSRQIESFLPTFETLRVWKNRQRVKVLSPLFPSYMFVRIRPRQRGAVLSTPGVLHMIGNARGPLAISDREVDFLRSEFCQRRVEPYHDLVVGSKVRIRSGAMEGMEGTLVQKKKSLRFVLTIKMINQNAAVEVQADELEAVSN
jgi:transcription antitermination factor NusG